MHSTINNDNADEFISLAESEAFETLDIELACIILARGSYALLFKKKRAWSGDDSRFAAIASNRGELSALASQMAEHHDQRIEFGRRLESFIPDCQEDSDLGLFWVSRLYDYVQWVCLKGPSVILDEMSDVFLNDTPRNLLGHFVRLYQRNEAKNSCNYGYSSDFIKRRDDDSYADAAGLMQQEDQQSGNLDTDIQPVNPEFESFSPFISYAATTPHINAAIPTWSYP